MKLKTRLTILFTLLFSAIILLLNIYIYYSYADFRKEGFYLRLETKALNTLRLFSEVDVIDRDLLKIIDRNSINELYEEKTIIFNEQYEIIYSSLDDHKIDYSTELFEKIKIEKYIEYTLGENEIVGIKHQSGDNKFYFVLCSAYDKYGRKELENLRFTLFLASLFGVLFVAIGGYFFIKNAFKPVEKLSKNIKSITGLNLKERVKIEEKDEFGELANSYNEMLDRLQNAFETQKTFVQHASHELRTPLSLLLSEIEKLEQNKNKITDEEFQQSISLLKSDIEMLSNLINSLLLLSKLDSYLNEKHVNLERIDEVIFDAIELIAEKFPDFSPSVSFPENISEENDMAIHCNKSLIKTLLVNLLENGYKYSDDKKVSISIDLLPSELIISFTNKGLVIEDSELNVIFTPFFRALNSTGKPGFGLGLSICNRIAQYHNGKLIYSKNEHLNTFKLILKR
jgi:two-component system, OmpR family, sensor histidine kinase ArlS